MNLERNRHTKVQRDRKAVSALSYLAGALVVLGATGCSSGTDVTEAAISPKPVKATVYVAQNNGAAAAGAVSRNNHIGVESALIETGTNEGVALDKAGNLVQAGDNGLNGADGIRTFCSAATLDGDPSLYSREISGALSLMTTPKGIAVAHEAGFYFVAQNTTDVLVFGSAAAGDVAPVATVTLPANAWDLAYDDGADRLFVAQTDGTVAVFDAFIEDDFGASGVARTIDPFDEGTDLSNLHGIAYDPQQDRLVVSDVGDPLSATDGKIFVIENASTAESTVAVPIVEPSKTISGADTLLGNPVDLVLTGVSLRVAEKSNDAILFYHNIFAGDGGNVAPDESYPFTDPESLAVAPIKVFPSVNDIGSGSSLAMTNIAVVSNVLAGSSVNHYARDLAAPSNTFDAGGAVSVENLTFDLNGDGYVTFDDDSGTAGTGGIGVIGRLAKRRDGEAVDPGRDREIFGAAVGLASPKGITIMGDTGLLAVAENGGATPGMVIFSACASGNVAPLVTVPTAFAPWDSDYDAGSDLLFVALTDGSVEVYADFAAAVADVIAGGVDPIEPVLTITLGAANLNGVHYDAGSDSLILSDVGDPLSDTDGVLFVVTDVSGLLEYADGEALAAVVLPVVAAVEGDYENLPFTVTGATAATVLGNPVDITFDGDTLYVANKTGTPAGILLFSDFLAEVAAAADPVTGVANLDADAGVVVTAAESVSLVPDFLSTAP